MKETSRSENRGAIVTEEPDLIPGVLPEAAVLPENAADPVLQESAKLAEITRQRRREARDASKAETVFELKDLAVTYSGSYAVQGVDMLTRKNEITALIGPSGCGKTTVLRCLNRTNDLIPGAKVEGGVFYHGIDLYGPKVEPVEVRRRIGMVFQKPNPFPKSIYDNVAFGPRVGGYKGNMDELVERSLPAGRRSADEVKRDLKASAMALSGGQHRQPVRRPLSSRSSPTSSSWTSPARALRARYSTAQESRSSWTSWCPSTRSSHRHGATSSRPPRVSSASGFFTVAEGQDEKDHRIGILVWSST